ncbi:MAG TPA: hypothetical protein VLJ61_09565 [Pyrinomonadaceae bacterium]|nr:hypothetical protein [Pyrinomonadaceae bacterium]
MPGERTLYRKIQVTLEYANEGKHTSVEALEEYMYQRSPTNFVYYWRDEKDKVRQDYSRNSIRDTVQLCVELGLVNDGELTQLGLNAVDPRRFPIIVGKQVTKFLTRKDMGIDSVQEAIGKIIKLSTPKPPTADEIWSHLKRNGSEIDLQTFKRLINLLGECKVLWMSQKRIYLPSVPQ